MASSTTSAKPASAIIDSANGIDGDSLRIKPSTTNALESSGIPLFSEEVPEPSIDAERNPGMMYQPMTRLGNLVTTRSNVYAIWVTVGYFEVEKAPDWNDPNVAVAQCGASPIWRHDERHGRRHRPRPRPLRPRLPRRLHARRRARHRHRQHQARSGRFTSSTAPSRSASSRARTSTSTR